MIALNVVIVSFDNDKFYTSSLAPIPMFIARRAALLLKKHPESCMAKYWLRLLIVALNNGVAIDLLGLCELSLNDSPEAIIAKPEHFERVILHFGNSENVFGPEIEELIKLPVSNYNDYVNSNSNEKTVCASFWNPLINSLFRTGKQVKHRLEWEWESTRLYPKHPQVKMDMVCLAEFTGVGGDIVSIPILLVEYGSKDPTKLFSLMAANCIALAHELISVGKNPKLARSYGMLNGGMKTQLCVAHPVVSKVDESDNFQIHSHISSLKHWEMNTFENEEIISDCNLACCAPSADISILETIVPPETLILQSNVPFDETEVDVEPKNFYENFPFDFRNKLASHSSFKKIGTFILLIKKQLEMIYSESIYDSSRSFILPIEKYYFASGAGTKQFPSIEESFRITKSSVKELEIYRKCSLYFPAFFPRIYEINRTEGGGIEYTFERMLPLFENGQCSALILGGTPMDNLVSSIKFTMNCLFNLHLLHKFIGVIHCDISPVNIMYSNVDMMWKFIDFDLSLETSKCKFETSRRVGTRDYIAPESEASGIYSESSDVFSLGSVIFDMIYQDLYRQFVYVDDPPSELLEFESIIVDMYDPLNRISVDDAMKNLLALLKRILPQEHEIFYDRIISRVEKFSSIIMEENILPANVKEIVSKARNYYSEQIEKEQRELQSFPTIEH